MKPLYLNNGSYYVEDLAKAIMAINQSCVVFNSPPARSGEAINDLAPYAPVRAYVVDQYPACPENWVRGAADVGSYFVGLDEGHELWFDFNGCWANPYHVAILVTVQGVNPLTRQKVSGKGLEQYVTNCPEHGEPFQQDRYCPKCEFKWPKQNYITTTGTPCAQLWLDGFVTNSGTIRQYLITKEFLRGIAAQTIGSERVWAIGFAFYTSKERKPAPKAPPTVRSKWSKGFSQETLGGSKGLIHAKKGGAGGQCVGDSEKMYCCSMPATPMAPGSSNFLSAFDSGVDSEARGFGLTNVDPEPLEKVTKLEIGAGVQVKQLVHPDPMDLSFWNEKPLATIYVNYTTTADVERIVKAGKREEKKEGFLSGLKVGN